jgi:hypothetical protein
MEIERGKERMDTGATPAHAGEDPRMEAVGAVHRPSHIRR